ncbi:MAG: glutamate 5-kinase [Clostridiales bacterium]|nr:glutamate 5-kinase [Clostridiales bacterium]
MQDFNGVDIMENKRTVVKVGTSTLTYENGKINYHRIEALCKVISDLQNSGEEIMLVSSGAIGVGMGKTGLAKRPNETKKKQALAAIGQCELMFMYDKLFGEYNHSVAQILLTRYAVETDQKRQNVINTIDELLSMNIIPVINENDTVAIDELDGNNFGDNDMLSAIVAGLVCADRLVILTDIDGLYDSNPRINKDARQIPVVKKITRDILDMAAGSGSNRGTGGMVTKLQAADYATKRGVEVHVINGSNPKNLYKIFDGKNVGTVFLTQP